MHIVIAGDFPEDPNTIVGGIQAVIFYTLKHLAKYENLEVSVVSCEKWGTVGKRGKRETKSLEKYLKRDWKAKYLPSSSRVPHTITMLTVDRWRVRDAIIDLAPDLIHAHGQAACYPWAAYDSGIPTVVTVHGLNALEARLDPRGGRLKSWLRAYIWEQVERACLRHAEDIIVISPFVEDLIRPYTRAVFHVIENPVQSNLFEIKREPILGRILYVGSIQKRKGLVDLVQAVKILHALDQSVHLRVAGGKQSYFEEYGRYVREMVKSLNINDQVQFLGHVDRKSLIAEYQNCAVFCLPSYLEASPVVVAEAMAAGCPIVTTNIASTTHLVNEQVTGLRVHTGNPGALADALGRIINNPEEAKELGQAARKEAQNRFTPEKAAAATYNLYRKLLGKVRG